MINQTVFRTLIVAVPLGVVALGAAYFYRGSLGVPLQDGMEAAPPPAVTADKSDRTERQTATAPVGVETAENPEQEESAAQAGAVAEKPVDGPSFDVVGVEPTGETVVAGRSEAGAIVALTANGEVVGKSIANEAGEWTIILEEPLKPGDYDVGLEVHDEKGDAIEESGQRLAVSVPEDGKQKPLVVLNDTEGPSDILQKPQTEELVAAAPAATADEGGAQEDKTVVAALPNPEADGQTTEAAPSNPEQRPVQSGGATAQPEDQSTQAAPESQVPVTEGAGNAAAKQAELPAQTQDGATVSGQPAAPARETDGTQAPAESASGEWSGNGIEEQPAGTAAIDEGSGPQQPAPPKVTVEAVESEPDKVYVAGTGKPGSSVRVYVGEDYQGEAKVNSSGKWLVQGTKNVAEGNVEVRADLIGTDGNSVDARAAVTFEKEQDKQIVLTKVVATGAGSGQGSQGADVQKSLPVVIIRKGDNLWRISRRLYGEGIRFTTIYQANQDQIRDPDLIYPGQVFLTPEGDRNWPDADNGTANRG